MEKVPSIKMANEIIHLSGLPIIHSCHCFVTRISKNGASHIFFFSFTFGNFDYIISSFYCKAERV